MDFILGVIKHGVLKNQPLIDDFPIKKAIKAMFDYQRATSNN